MRKLRLGGLAIAAALGLVTLAAPPVALAAPGAKPAPSPKPPKTSPRPSPSPVPTVTKTTTTTATPIAPCVTPQSIPASRLPGVPWAQQRLGFTDVWDLTRGKGVTVAVVDSGINQDHPQLAGRVAKSIDLTHTHNTDCYGHGTAVAGIIAAQDQRNSRQIPFLGVAPDVRLISIKIQESEQSSDGGALLAKGIERAVQEGADIINVSAVNVDFPALRAAVRLAQQHDVLIVAAAGNTDPTKRANEQAAYPASYHGVLSVGALGPAGEVAGFSNVTSKVDVSAPGQDIVSTYGSGYNQGLNGTSYSAPYVTGVAALVKASKPDLTYQQIISRITGTADRSVGTGSGGGMISPHLAVTTLLGDLKSSGPAPQVGAEPIRIGGPRPVDHHTRAVGALVAVGAVGAALLVAGAGAVVPLGIRRGWRPGRVTLPPDDRSR